MKHYTAYPPPLFWVALLFAVGFVIHGVSVTYEPQRRPIAGYLDSDKPLADDGSDALNLRPIAARQKSYS